MKSIKKIIIVVVGILIVGCAGESPQIAGTDLDIWRYEDNSCRLKLEDDPITVTFRVRNGGSEGAAESIAKVAYDFDDDNLDHEQDIQVPAIAGGKNEEVSTQWDSTCRSENGCVIRLQVDANDNVVETLEDNNSEVCQDPVGIFKVKGEDSSVADKTCNSIQPDGSVKRGECKDVCKGKDVSTDHAGRCVTPGELYCGECPKTVP